MIFEKKIELENPFIRYAPGVGAVFSLLPIQNVSINWMIESYSHMYVIYQDSLSTVLEKTAGLTGEVTEYGFTFPNEVPGIDIERISKRSILDIYKTFIEFIIDQLLLDKCIYVFINCRYIQNFEIEYDNVHPILIYAFNFQEKIFYFRHYLFGSYIESGVSKDELEKSVMNSGIYNDFFYQIVYLLQKKKIFTKTCENTNDTLIDSIHWHLKSCEKKDNCFKGKNVYNGIFLNWEREIENFPFDYNVGLLFALCEHKKVIFEGIKHLSMFQEKKELLQNDYLDIMRMANKVKIGYLHCYYSLANYKGQFKNLEKYLKDISEREEGVYKCILDSLLEQGQEE